MKLCRRCKIEKSKEQFSKRSRGKDGLSAWCKQCFSDYDRERYQNGDKERKQRNNKARRDKMRDNLWQLLCNSECRACGNNDPEVLEFDHRDETEKQFNVSEMLHSYSWENILTEIAKCDILCANCHRKRTIKQFDLWRGKMINPGIA